MSKISNNQVKDIVEDIVTTKLPERAGRFWVSGIQYKKGDIVIVEKTSINTVGVMNYANVAHLSEMGDVANGAPGQLNQNVWSPTIFPSVMSSAPTNPGLGEAFYEIDNDRVHDITSSTTVAGAGTTIHNMVWCTQADYDHILTKTAGTLYMIT